MRYFGTDGIRGLAGSFCSPKLAFLVGFSVAKILKKTGQNNHILVGSDTRLSGGMLSMAVASGSAFAGVDVIDVGVVPTPAVAFLTKKYSAIAGIMITASHNPPEYNGIKIFSSDGIKASEELQNKVEEMLDKLESFENLDFDIKMGKIHHEKQAVYDYVEYLKNTLGGNLSGLSIVLDVCFGASFFAAPQVFEMLGAKVIVLHANPDGEQINVNSGATNVTRLSGAVLREHADVGFAFDGDADRVIAVDEEGNEVDGDKILFVLAEYMKAQNKLPKSTVVGTIISTLALEVALKKEGISLIRVDVGDEHIVREMVKNDFYLGGERCGHIILKEYFTTGDGVLPALKLAKILKEKNKKFSELVKKVKSLPSLRENINMDKDKKELLSKNEEFAGLLDRLGHNFPNLMIIARPSGTENKFRIDVQGTSKKAVQTAMEQIKKFVVAFIEGK